VTFYIWKRKYANLGVSELRELRQLRDENTRLKRLMADLTLDKQILSDVVKKSSEAVEATRFNGLDHRHLPAQRTTRLRPGRFLTCGMVSTEHGDRSIGAQTADQRNRVGATAFWLLAMDPIDWTKSGLR